MYVPSFRLSRRGMLGTMTAVGAAGALAACSQDRDESSSKKNTGLDKSEATNDVDKLMANNPQPVDKLEKGGSLTMTVASLGPNWNVWSNAGNQADSNTIYSSIDRAGLWSSEADGTPTLNKYFCEDAKYDENGGKPIITYTLNPKAQYNDGTPFDWKVLENTWKMNNGSDPNVDVVTTDGYDRIESVKPGKDDREVVVQMTKPYQPWQDIFAGVIHPKVNTADIFNNGFVNNMHPEWTAGPFKLEKLDLTQKRVTMVPNEKWWGEKPILDRIVYIQMEDQATIPAFKNGEIDMTGVANADRYNQVKGMKDIDIRRSQRTSVYGLNFNTKRGNLGDEAVRKAIYQGIDRKAVADIRFTGINWTEKLPGSWMLMPFNPLYEDNYPGKHDVEAAKKTLEEGGWTGKDGEVRKKDGKTLDISMTNFGDDPTTNAIAQTIQKQLKDLGFNATIDSKGAGDFGKVMDERTFELVMMGYTVGSDPTGVVNQFFNSKSDSNMTGTGSAEIDKLIPDASVDPDVKERAKLANKIEKMFQEKYAMMPIWNGPVISAYKKGIANYGPQLYLTQNWSIVGWEKGTKQG